MKIFIICTDFFEVTMLVKQSLNEHHCNPLEYVPVGPRFSNSVLQALRALLNEKPPKVGCMCSHPFVFIEGLEYRCVFIVATSIRSLIKFSITNKIFTYRLIYNED